MIMCLWKETWYEKTSWSLIVMSLWQERDYYVFVKREDIIRENIIISYCYVFMKRDLLWLCLYEKRHNKRRHNNLLLLCLNEKRSHNLYYEDIVRKDIIRDLVARKKRQDGENERWGLGQIDRSHSSAPHCTTLYHSCWGVCPPIMAIAPLLWRLKRGKCKKKKEKRVDSHPLLN